MQLWFCLKWHTWFKRAVLWSLLCMCHLWISPPPHTAVQPQHLFTLTCYKPVVDIRSCVSILGCTLYWKSLWKRLSAECMELDVNVVYVCLTHHFLRQLYFNFILFCSLKEKIMSDHEFAMTWQWVTDDSIFLFWVNCPLQTDVYLTVLLVYFFEKYTWLILTKKYTYI